MEKICIAVYVFGNYTRYAPYYIYSILKSYPNYYVKVFSKDPLSANENTALELIRNQVSPNFEVVEGYLGEYINLEDPSKMVGSIGTMLRFLIPYEEFKDFKYVYIGDIDFLIIREKPTLLDVHKKHSKKIGVPYSNAIRPNSKRLTGLHFFKVKDYYKKMNPIIQYYLNNPNKLYNEVKELRYDEEFLYKIIEKGIGFGKIEEHFFRPPHGFHIGVARQGDDQEKLRKIDRYLNQKKLISQGVIEQLDIFFNDPIFKKIMLLTPDNSIKFLEKRVKHFKPQ
ncbi:hypothetical protein M3E13_05505 [Oceanobacillus kimchii]|uniref:hypothetical protein n=1 Tax=Oceanobacillus kimchii TaxID=746691 RepID=UPI000349E7F5|nr:hypothetical protein [Oceanobacillus kimchii]MCT1575731.1 hypothetical protein [Oceanobacillus kimchii]MCT2135368.1 hypothetical protein [Oceanobacillus kimchii]